MAKRRRCQTCGTDEGWSGTAPTCLRCRDPSGEDITKAACELRRHWKIEMPEGDRTREGDLMWCKRCRRLVIPPCQKCRVERRRRRGPPRPSPSLLLLTMVRELLSGESMTASRLAEVLKVKQDTIRQLLESQTSLFEEAWEGVWTLLVESDEMRFVD